MEPSLKGHAQFDPMNFADLHGPVRAKALVDLIAERLEPVLQNDPNLAACLLVYGFHDRAQGAYGRARIPFEDWQATVIHNTGRMVENLASVLEDCRPTLDELESQAIIVAKRGSGVMIRPADGFAEGAWQRAVTELFCLPERQIISRPDVPPPAVPSNGEPIRPAAINPKPSATHTEEQRLLKERQREYQSAASVAKNRSQYFQSEFSAPLKNVTRWTERLSLLELALQGPLPEQVAGTWAQLMAKDYHTAFGVYDSVRGSITKSQEQVILLRQYVFLPGFEKLSAEMRQVVTDTIRCGLGVVALRILGSRVVQPALTSLTPKNIFHNKWLELTLTEETRLVQKLASQQETCAKDLAPLFAFFAPTPPPCIGRLRDAVEKFCSFHPDPRVAKSADLSIPKVLKITPEQLQRAQALLGDDGAVLAELGAALREVSRQVHALRPSNSAT